MISALIINAKSENYVSSRFSSYLIAYKNNANARSIIDRVQQKYQCCGTDIWIDWVRGDLNGTSTATLTTPLNVATPTAATVVTNSTMSINMATPTGIVRLSTANDTTLQTVGAIIGKRDIHPISNDLSGQPAVQFSDYSRKKRQAPSTYGGIAGLPTDFYVVLPGSCCTSDATLTSNSSDACMYHLVFLRELRQNHSFFVLKIVFRLAMVSSIISILLDALSHLVLLPAIKQWVLVLSIVL